MAMSIIQKWLPYVYASLRKKLNYTQDPNTEKKLIITHPRIGYQMQHLE